MRHYAKSRGIGTVTNPLPATNVKRHPVDGWILASTMPWKDYMPYVIQPEQQLVQMPESELYASLVSLREQILTAPSPGSSAVPILETHSSLDRGYFPHKWCDIRQMRVAKTFAECNEVNECRWFLRKGLETYENLRSHRPTRRNRRRNRTAEYLDSGSDSVMGSDEAEATSDEESLAVMRKKQANDIRKMEIRVRELIEEFKQRYPQWQKSYNPVMRELDHRLEKVENI